MPVVDLEEQAEKTRNPKESLFDEIYSAIFESNKQVENDTIAQKIVLSGKNGFGKTSLALALLTEDLADDEKIVYVGIDNSGSEIINKFFKKELHAGQLLPFNPDARKLNDRGVWVRDEERVLEKVTTTSSVIKQALDNGIKVKAVIVDGISFLLEYAEAKMRMERNLDADSGTQLNLWKIRAKFFREFTSAYMALDIPVIFVSHEDFAEEYTEPGKELSSVKKRLIDECGVRILLGKRANSENNHVEDYYATIKKNRSNGLIVGKESVFMSFNNDADIAETNYKDLKDLIFPQINEVEQKK